MIPVNIPEITDGDIASVVSALKDGWISGEGPVITEFEALVAENSGRKYAAAVSNGSDALDLAFMALGLEPGDEVILPTFTIISCLAPLLRMGLTPVFLDADPLTWNMDVSRLRSLVTKRTKAILMVHIYGLTVDIDPVLEIAKEFNLFVIEDAAEAQGIKYKDKPCGSFGDISTFSFYANKNLTTGEGGMVLTDDANLAEKVRYYRNLTFRPDERFVHQDLGWNMRLSSLQAALGISQLSRLRVSVEKRVSIAGAYIEKLGLNPFLQFQATHSTGTTNGYWVVGVVLKNHPEFSNAKEAMLALARAGIATRPFFYPLHLQPVLGKFTSLKYQGPHLANSENLYANGFYLPNGLGMSTSQLEQAVSTSAEILSA